MWTQAVFVKKKNLRFHKFPDTYGRGLRLLWTVELHLKNQNVFDRTVIVSGVHVATWFCSKIHQLIIKLAKSYFFFFFEERKRFRPYGHHQWRTWWKFTYNLVLFDEVILKGNSFAIKECTCLFRVGFSQAISRPSIILSSEGWFSRCTQCFMCMRGLDVLRGDGLARSYETCSRVLPFALG